MTRENRNFHIALEISDAPDDTPGELDKRQERFKSEVRKGIEAADNGKFATKEEMTSLFKKYGA